MASVTVSASPRRATAEPPSGTALPFAENENIALVRPPAFWVVKAQVMAVGSNPLPLTIPLPSITRVEAFRVTTVDERRSKVKPPTLQRPVEKRVGLQRRRSGAGMEQTEARWRSLITVLRKRDFKSAPDSRVQAKWPLSERPLFVANFSPSRNGDRLTHQEAAHDAKRTKCRAEQHHCGTAVRNTLTTWAKERPAGKAILAEELRNCNDST
jgi:hypothetical protein